MSVLDITQEVDDSERDWTIILTADSEAFLRLDRGEADTLAAILAPIAPDEAKALRTAATLPPLLCELCGIRYATWGDRCGECAP